MKFSIYLHILTFIIVLLPWHFTGLYGFDWTDTTYNFQQAINVINGLEINKDFFIHVPGLSFVIEAFILEIFGKNYENHRNLGLIFPAIQYICSVLVVSKILYEHDQKNYGFWSVIFSSLILISYWGFQLSWDVTGLAITFSYIAATLIFFLNYIENKFSFYFFLFLIALVTILQIFTKQSHGLINLILIFFSVIIVLFFKKKNIYTLTKSILALCIFVILNLFLISYLSGILIPISFSENLGSLDLKGLSIERPIEILLTIVGVSSETVVSFIFIVFISIFIKVFLKKNNFSEILIVPLILIPLFAYYNSKIWIFLYYSLFGFLIYQFFYLYREFFFIKKFEKYKLKRFKLLFSCLPLFGSVIAEQLSWPGPHYIRPALITYVFLILVLIFSVKKINNLVLYKKFFIFYLIFVFFNSLFFIETKPRGYEHKKNGLVEIKNIQSFNGWKVSENTHKTLNKLTKASLNCNGDTLFQLSWMPIVYEITSRKNLIGYDLPYHDTINLKEGIKITQLMLINPPDMLVVQPDFFDYKGPFPAKGMKFIFNNLDQILYKYDLIEFVKDQNNTFQIYCLKK